MLDGCTAWVQQRTLTLQKQVAQKVLDDGQRELGRQQGRLDDLKREKTRAENGLVKAAQKSEEAAKDKAAAETELEQLNADTSLPSDSAAAVKAERDRGKQRAKLQDRIKRLAHAIDSAKKKTDDLNWAIKRNVQDQAAQQQIVDKQQAVVNDLQGKLQAIH
jgi:chromosome segregation ATPase